MQQPACPFSLPDRASGLALPEALRRRLARAVRLAPVLGCFPEARPLLDRGQAHGLASAWQPRLTSCRGFAAAVRVVLPGRFGAEQFRGASAAGSEAGDGGDIALDGPAAVVAQLQIGNEALP
jgi:hypothetical protein